MAVRAPEPSLLVILGGTGDLTRAKLLPALANLARSGKLGAGTLLLGTGRKKHKDELFRTVARKALGAARLKGRDIERWVEEHVYYQGLGEGEAGYAALGRRVSALEREHGLSGNRVFYVALPPAAVPAAIAGLGRAGLSRGPGFTRLVIEKPFGSDLESSRSLDRLVHEHFDEAQVYRIDHYLGKESVQNLLVFRFANPIFESIWNRDRLESVQITVAESAGIGSRGAFYDQTGALRDMVQNHLTQILTLIAMEIPSSFAADAIRFEKLKVLHSVRPIAPPEVVFGQYQGYGEEKDVHPSSSTETFVALKLTLDSWRWQGVPFYIRTGKKLPRRLTEIAVTFRKPPVHLFQSLGPCNVHSNVLVMTLQPDEGFSLYFDVKTPGEPFGLRALPLQFAYKEAFPVLPEAYETLILDVLTGDQTLFVHAEEVDASWRLYTPLLERAPEVHPYKPGSWGPKESEQLLVRDGHLWHTA